MVYTDPEGALITVYMNILAMIVNTGGGMAIVYFWLYFMTQEKLTVGEKFSITVMVLLLITFGFIIATNVTFIRI